MLKFSKDHSSPRLARLLFHFRNACTFYIKTSISIQLEHTKRSSIRVMNPAWGQLLTRSNPIFRFLRRSALYRGKKLPRSSSEAFALSGRNRPRQMAEACRLPGHACQYPTLQGRTSRPPPFQFFSSRFFPCIYHFSML